MQGECTSQYEYKQYHHSSEKSPVMLSGRFLVKCHWHDVLGHTTRVGEAMPHKQLWMLLRS